MQHVKLLRSTNAKISSKGERSVRENRPNVILRKIGWFSKSRVCVCFHVLFAAVLWQHY